MLRPERMSRVSVTGSKRVMDDVVEAVHDLRMLHVTEYDGSWEGFEPGDPIEGAESASEKLVTVRSLQSILGVDEDDAGPTQLVTEEALDEELEEVRQEVNELDDRREELRDELREVEDEIDTLDPFVRLGIDLDLLKGYDTLSVAVGEGDADEVREALAASDVDDYEVFAEDGVLAAFARADRDDLQDALVGAHFTELEVPEGDIDPVEYRDELENRRQQLESDLDAVESELEDLRADVSGFLLAAEETLTIEVQKREAPLTFATTENAFIAEGWIPDDEYGTFEQAIQSAVGEAVDVEKLEVAEYDGHGHPEASEETDPGGVGGGEATIEATPAASDGEPDAEETTAEEGQKVTDGGLVTMGDEPPVIQDNPGPIKPFEDLVEVVNRPKYGEFDPTVVFFLTFPAFFGFMIGDLGYGILYTLLGYWLYASADSDVLKSLGGVGMWAGGFTMLFGVLYGEVFGLHQLGEIVWGGDPPIHKGLQPAYGDYAVGWLVVSLLVGMVHLAVGWTFDFIENLEHGFKEAMYESGSWLMMMFGLWTWIFADAPPTGSAPDQLVGSPSRSVFAGNPFDFGFLGLPDPIGLAGLAVFLLGLVILSVGAPTESVEFLNVLVNVLSYTRLAAVTLAKAGMAFVVNLLFFGVYVTGHGDEAEWHFATGHMPHVGEMSHGHEVTEIMFGGLIHSGIAGALLGVLVLVLGHLLVLVLGITSAGLQGVRLEYVEFFNKFFEGGGKRYNPFGYERSYTTED